MCFSVITFRSLGCAYALTYLQAVVLAHLHTACLLYILLPYLYTTSMLIFYLHAYILYACLHSTCVLTYCLLAFILLLCLHNVAMLTYYCRALLLLAWLYTICMLVYYLHAYILLRSLAACVLENSIDMVYKYVVRLDITFLNASFGCFCGVGVLHKFCGKAP
jgi:hypothetical protein